MIRASIVGASGYTGGELLRLLLFHPNVEIKQVTSERLAGKLVSGAHPNLRKICSLKFNTISELEGCDVLFLCLPHGETMGRIDEFKAIAPKLIELSADFRLRETTDYDRWYARRHARPELWKELPYGLPPPTAAQLDTNPD